MTNQVDNGQSHLECIATKRYVYLLYMRKFGGKKTSPKVLYIDDHYEPTCPFDVSIMSNM